MSIVYVWTVENSNLHIIHKRKSSPGLVKFSKLVIKWMEFRNGNGNGKRAIFWNLKIANVKSYEGPIIRFFIYDFFLNFFEHSNFVFFFQS